MKAIETNSETIIKTKNQQTIGIVGGGQLARMMILAGTPLGLNFIILDPSPEACASKLCTQIVAEYDDISALNSLSQQVDIITFDFENVPSTALAQLVDCKIYPPIAALATSQDRITEKNLFQTLNIPTPAFAAIESLEDLKAALVRVGYPAILKTRRLGYDGKGQIILRSADDCIPALLALGEKNLILEQFIPFSDEVSIIAVRNKNAETVYYPLIKNTHLNGILKQSIAPFNDDALMNEAKAYANALLNKLDYIGTLAIEFFVKEGQLIANEMAPRVHNSGHLTIEGASTSQFENHLRAILNWPLGQTTIEKPTAMINFIGELPDKNAYLATPHCHYHNYGKSARQGRKVGHATIIADNLKLLNNTLAALAP